MYGTCRHRPVVDAANCYVIVVVVVELRTDDRHIGHRSNPLGCRLAADPYSSERYPPILDQLHQLQRSTAAAAAADMVPTCLPHYVKPEGALYRHQGTEGNV